LEALTHTFPCKPNEFVRLLNQLQVERHGNTFGSTWKQRDLMAQDHLKTYFETARYADLTVFETILDYLPEMSHLHMANSSVVRYCQLFDPVSSISYWGNRGTSGIDGSTSTACGAALVKKEDWNVLITGDISFFYDSNALWNNNLTSNLRIIIINNGGGGIFKIIPGPKSTNQLDKYFVAEHNFSAEHLCKAYNINYFKATSLTEIDSNMEGFYSYEEGGRPKLLEIFTPKEINDVVLNEFFEKMKTPVNKAVNKNVNS
jgi:2-succinyl-5-enolpyruvyl-6-hydroxy-3-cyclohexene-1-carboxylate synthase